jgi:hypothetical protein
MCERLHGVFAYGLRSRFAAERYQVTHAKLCDDLTIWELKIILTITSFLNII